MTCPTGCRNEHSQRHTSTADDFVLQLPVQFSSAQRSSSSSRKEPQQAAKISSNPGVVPAAAAAAFMFMLTFMDVSMALFMPATKPFEHNSTATQISSVHQVPATYSCRVWFQDVLLVGVLMPNRQTDRTRLHVRVSATACVLFQRHPFCQLQVC